MMTAHVLMPDTQAILLLCAGFGQTRLGTLQPLSLGEYNYLAQWLQQHHLRPANLMTHEGKDQLLAMSDSILDSKRVIALLERGAMLGLAVENWTNKGLWVLSRSDEAYPRALKTKLRHLAPPILYGTGKQELLSGGGVAIIGSRDVDEEGLEFTQRVAKTCAKEGSQVVSGGARGVDQAAMLAAVNVGGTSVGVLADSLAQASVSKKYRDGIRASQLTLVSPYDPDARFHVGNAMARNKYVYALADYALVVSSAFNQGGTWTGVTEVLKQEYSVPVFVRLQGTVPEGNQQLVKLGAKPFPEEPWNQPLSSLLLQGSLQSTTVTHADSSKRVDVDVVALASTQKYALAEEPVVVDADHTHPKDAFAAVLSLILNHLQEPKEEKLLAELLDVRVMQLRDWLKRAIAEGRVKKTKKGYVTMQENDQLSLFN